MTVNSRFKSLFFVFVFMMIFGIIGTIDANAQPCDDGNPCTMDRIAFVPAPGCPTFCDNAGCCPEGSFECVGTPLPDGPCVGFGCLPGSSCDMGVCELNSGGETILCNEIPDCDDGNLCTSDIFDFATGECSNIDRNFPPRPGSCQGTVCDPTDGSIEFINDASLCDDGISCNGMETCSALGQCQSGTPVDIDDGVSCTIDSCDEIEGVTHIPDNSLCDNGLFCDGEEVCDMTQGCLDGPDPTADDGIECTVEICNEDLDQIISGAESSLCDDGLFCTGTELCDPGEGCVTTFSIPDDGIACTDRRCDEELDAYVFDPNDSFCNNGDFCDGVETCDPENAEFGSGGCVTTDVPEVGTSCNDGEGVCDEEMMCAESTGTIKIVKMADPNDGQDFLFLCADENGDPCTVIDLDGDGVVAFPLDDEEADTDGVPNMMTFTGIPAGEYRFSEAVEFGWGLVDIVCEGDLDDGSGIDVTEVIIDLDPFEEITCTFFNELLCGNGMLDDDEECDPGITPDFCSDACVLFDSDSDGITDEFDDCPDTEAGVVVDEFGCPIEDEMICDCNDPNAITQGFPFRGRTYFYGTFGDDIICGTSERDVIFAFAGNDCIDAGAGNDAIFAGFGNDIADGGDDNDFVHGGFGFDICFGERTRRCEED